QYSPRPPDERVEQRTHPQADKLYRQTGQRHVHRTQPHPPALEPAPAEPGARDGAGKSTGPLQTSSFSSTGSTDTTCRLNFSSESATPAATPTSCDRCRIGIWKSFPVWAFSFDCHASSDRWHSGHGVTNASAPASLACSIGWISSPSAVSSPAL